MILTGPKILEEVKNGSIEIEPFNDAQLNPNSYNSCLGDSLKIFKKFNGDKYIFEEVKIPDSGYVMEVGVTYLATTFEVIGSNKYAMSLIGRSSIGRYGLFLQASANLGHTASKHKWTLEMIAAIPIRIYPKMTIGQVSFWKNEGDINPYRGRYGHLNYPQESFM